MISSCVLMQRPQFSGRELIPFLCYHPEDTALVCGWVTRGQVAIMFPGFQMTLEGPELGAAAPGAPSQSHPRRQQGPLPTCTSHRRSS